MRIGGLAQYINYINLATGTTSLTSMFLQQYKEVKIAIGIVAELDPKLGNLDQIVALF